MMHFFRRSKIHLDTFTCRKDVIEYAPVVNAIEVIPEWWKKLPKKVFIDGSTFPLPTMKTCIGMSSYYKNSVALPLWSELCIEANQDNYAWQFSDRKSVAHMHDPYQYDGFLGKNYGHLKLESPWVFETKSDIDWLLTDAIYNKTELVNYAIPPGLLNFSKQNNTNIQLFINLTNNHSFTIPLHTPVLFTPLSDKKVVVHRHLISPEEFTRKRQMSSQITFINAYGVSQKVVKCPYKDATK